MSARNSQRIKGRSLCSAATPRVGAKPLPTEDTGDSGATNGADVAVVRGRPITRTRFALRQKSRASKRMSLPGEKARKLGVIPLAKLEALKASFVKQGLRSLS